MILYFDTETTGLMPGKIVQLSYIMESKEKLTTKNFFFAVDYVEPSALAVHGFSPEKLFELSGGKIFSDHAAEIAEDFAASSLVVAHNFSFDLNFLIKEFEFENANFRYSESLDSMRYFTPILKLSRSSNRGYKFPKLSELAAFFEVFPYDVSRFVRDSFGELALNNHDARFDTAQMYLSITAARKVFAEFNSLIDNYL